MKQNKDLRDGGTMTVGEKEREEVRGEGMKDDECKTRER